MDKYKKLISNTFIFAIGTFSSKVLVFLLMPLYTLVLTTQDFGVVDLVVQTGNLLIPIVSVGVINAIVRFGLDDNVNKGDVFSTGLFTILCGFGLLLVIEPLMSLIPYLQGNTTLIYLFVLMSCMRALCSQFTRAKGYVRLYALDGVLSTIATIVFNVLFLVVFKWGINGYVMAIFTADFLSAGFLFISARLHRYVKLGGINKDTVKAMFRYCVPLIPTTTFWWIMNVCDRYVVTEVLGSSANGLLAVAYKVPTIVTLVSTIFMDAWQISAFTETNKLARERFFSKVFRTYQSMLFAAASGLILFSKVITDLLISNESYYESWRYIPYLVMATTFSCMVNFLGTIYMAEKKNAFALVTTAIGAVVNVVLNLWLIPLYGVNGGTFATFVSYFLVFVLRAVDTRRLIKINMNVVKLVFNTLILGAQSMIMIDERPHWIVYEIGFTALMLVMNMGDILSTVKKLLPQPAHKRPRGK